MIKGLAPEVACYENALFVTQGCQIFLGPNIPKREKYNK
jgi:hypothetical protein